MIFTDEERREVARKLRDTREIVYEFRKELSEEGAYIHCDDQADYYLICKCVTGYIPCEYMNPCDYAEIHERLADLIDPEPERTCRLRYDEVHRDYVCSSCGMWLSLDSYQRETEDGQVYRMFRYCPECGARVNR